jgi:[ribosomal protein S18]-alanine N-acetyltransferase
MHTIRRATLADLPALLDIENSSFSTDIISPRQMRYLVTQAKCMCWVAEADQQLLAYSILFTPKLPRAARLYSIAVRTEARGQSIAKELIEQAHVYAKQKNYSKIVLEVRKEQHHVVKLYQQLGFSIVRTLAHYYEDGADAYKMEKDLTGKH